MNKISLQNKKAWSYDAYNFWVKEMGTPEEEAQRMTADPSYYLRRHTEFLGNVESKKIANLLGSCGKKAIPLALLGADVTVVDISDSNRKYAMETASAAGVDITYILSDLLELDTKKFNDFDIAYLEGGILHYFSNIDKLAAKIYELLKPSGKLILNDFHPIRKIFKERDIFVASDSNIEVTGDYFESEIHEEAMAHQKYYDGQAEIPKCLLRYWTLGEIITSFASAGFIIEQLIEAPRFDKHKNIPGEFTLVARK